jgi:hypothetical protein
MDLTDGFEPLVIPADQENFTGLGGCELILLTQEEAEYRIGDKRDQRVFDGDLRRLAAEVSP